MCACAYFRETSATWDLQDWMGLRDKRQELFFFVFSSNYVAQRAWICSCSQVAFLFFS